MAITAYVGLPGHGKSYGVVENVIIPALEKKRIIFTNIPMNTDIVFERFQINVIQFEVEDIKNNPNWWTEVFTAGAIFVLDEVPKLWPAGLKANAMHENDRAFLAEHRHMVGDEGTSTEIVLVVQNLSMVASFARGLIETTFWVVKHVKMGSSKRFRVDVYSGVMAGQNPQLARREREIQGKFKPEVYSLYKSHTKSKSGIAGDESKMDNRNNMFKGFGIKLGVISIVIFAIATYFGLKKVSTFYEAPEKKEEVITGEKKIERYAVKQVPVKKKKEGFLDYVDSIIFSHQLNERVNNRISSVNYFKVSMGNSEGIVSDFELKKLGYRITSLSDCLYQFTHDNYEKYVMCPKVNPDKSIFETLVVAE